MALKRRQAESSKDAAVCPTYNFLHLYGHGYLRVTWLTGAGRMSTRLS